MYHEALRPQLHFSARRGWHNDPNGGLLSRRISSVLPTQIPTAGTAGNMHWGMRPARIYFTGRNRRKRFIRMHSARNTALAVTTGRTRAISEKTDRPPMVMVYTEAGDQFSQCVAYSADGERPLRSMTATRSSSRSPAATGIRRVLAMNLRGNG